MNENKPEKNYFKKVKNTISFLPKAIKLAIFIAIVGIIIWIGASFTGVSSHTKATNFGLKDVGELITQTAYVTIVQDSKEDREFFNLFKIPFTESRMIFSYDFTVDASINFEKITYTIDDSKKEITVKMPHAKHYKTTIVIDSQEVYLDEAGLFTRIDLKEQNKAMLDMENEARETAIKNNLLGAAEKNAETIVSSMLKSDKNRKNYNVVFNYE